MRKFKVISLIIQQDIKKTIRLVMTNKENNQVGHDKYHEKASALELVKLVKHAK
jgi:hypothetical protein